MLAQLSGEMEADGSLDLATGDRVLLVVVGESGGLGGDPLEDVVDERVHDAHGLAGDARVGVHLLQHLVDVDGVALLAPPPLRLPAYGLRATGPQARRLLLALLRGYFPRHGAVDDGSFGRLFLESWLYFAERRITLGGSFRE